MSIAVQQNDLALDLDSTKAGQVALKFFFNLMDKWDCTVEQQMVLLGSIGRSTLYKYRQLPEVRLPRDTMERVSYLMGIHKSLRILFGDKPSTYEWIKKANSEAPFNGNSALQVMLAGGVVDLADVRRYLDGVRG
ncbi:MbcA/ParS/Xre antitoxin family protein [Pseudomonas sp. EA_35y_Pfl2_R111]|uniref:MbcA/ParS/Xre antitoxin family protein n=1 Tax=Pseudomonas sp. EA_35y_Pfl2_R111 TaxID=3088689 RepID=UPI0030DC2B5D